jgi:class 3 adenylate cyclase
MQTIQGLVACSDLTGYAKLTARKSGEEIFPLLSGYYELVGDLIAPASGQVIKFMGDAALMLFPEAAADLAVLALFTLQSHGDRFLSERALPCRHHLRVHFGPVCLGEIGTRTDKRPDILGPTVNTLFTLRTDGFVLTPEAFRRLAPDSRKLFKKHTPPVTYIPLDHPHRN